MRRTIIAALLVAIVIPAAGADAPPGRKAWVGMGLTLRTDPGGGKFVYVVSVPEGTPASKAGMADGDVVTAINGKKISFRDDLDIMELVAACKPGDTIRFRVIRSGKSKEIAVKTGELPREYEEMLRLSLERAREQRKRTETKEH